MASLKTLRSVVLSALAIAVAAPIAAGQVQTQQQVETVGVPPQPLGPTGRSTRTGTGRIRGRVLSAESGTPIRRVQVRITGPDIGNRVMTTDNDGRYDFPDLPDGRFSVFATKAGYVSVQYGQTRPFESGKAIELADKQLVDKADIAMPRGSVISGRIVDETGEPIVEATVAVMRQQWTGGRRRLVPTGRTAQTNDLGQFRVYGLAPGDYFVSGSLRNMEGLAMDMLAANSGAPLPTRPSAPAAGYAPTYYPGTTSMPDAQKVVVAVGQESQGVDFALASVRLARITGMVLNSEGRPVEGSMIMLVPGRGLEPNPVMPGTSRTSREGTFMISNVAPGDYTLQARGVTITTTNAGGDMTFTTRMGTGDGAEFAVLPVSVSGEDLANLVVTTSKGASAVGRVTFEGDRPANAAAIRVISTAVEQDAQMMISGSSPAVIQPDGSFELKGLVGSPRLLRVGGLPNGWSLKAVHLNGADVTDTGVEFKGSDAVTGFDIVLTPRSTDISGSVTSQNGAPVRDYTVVVFADDPSKWSLPATRWLTGARPDQAGRYRVRGLPAGAYYGVAVDYLPQGEWADPDVLDRLRGKAQRFTLDEGETKTHST